MVFKMFSKKHIFNFIMVQWLRIHFAMQGTQFPSLVRELKFYRQEELVTGEGEEVGDGRAEQSSAVGDGVSEEQLHSCLTLMAQVLVPSWNQMHVHII